MAKVLCVMGDSGAGKTTSMRNLKPHIILTATRKVFRGKAGKSSTFQA